MNLLVNRRVVSAILKHASPEGITIKELISRERLDSQMLERDLHALGELSLVSVLDRSIYVSPAQKVRLSVEALSLGCSLGDLCKSLSWGEFEDFSLEALHANNFSVCKHFRFKSNNRRWEIDLVALRGSQILLIDCKHWSKGHQASSLRRAAEKSLVCTKALLAVMPSLSERLAIDRLSSVVIFPVILTLLRSPVQIHLGVPVVSISQFNDFIYELSEYENRLTVFSIQLKGATCESS